MLLVTAAGPDEKVGDVTHLGSGLYQGIIDRFALYDHANDLSLDIWTQLCATTAAMVDQDPIAATDFPDGNVVRERAMDLAVRIA